MPYKLWAVGEEVLAADFNDYLQEQVIATFPSAAARDAAIVAPNAGQACYVVGTGFQVWNGTAWAAYLPGAPRVLFEHVATANSAAIPTTGLAIPGRSVTFTPQPGRAYYMHFGANVTPSVSQFFTAKALSPGLGGTQYGSMQFVIGNLQPLWQEGTTALILPTGAPITISLVCNTNTGTAIINAAANAPALWQILERDATPITAMSRPGEKPPPDQLTPHDEGATR